MKNILLASILSVFTLNVFAQEKLINLERPSTDRGHSVMKALELRASATEFDTVMLKLQDLSDLVWAANGINRENGKRTAPSAVNAQDVDVYVVLKSGAYIYDANNHVLNLVAGGDHRALVAGRQANYANAPVYIVLISDISRFKGDDTNNKLKMAAIDAGIISQNIALFCAATDLSTRPRATMEVDRLREVLKLKESQHPILNNPVSYKKK